jgi:hypothetical protein
VLEHIVKVGLDHRRNDVAADLGGELVFIAALSHLDDWLDLFLDPGLENVSNLHRALSCSVSYSRSPRYMNSSRIPRKRYVRGPTTRPGIMTTTGPLSSDCVLSQSRCITSLGPAAG